MVTSAVAVRLSPSEPLERLRLAQPSTFRTLLRPDDLGLNLVVEVTLDVRNEGFSSGVYPAHR